MRSRREDAEAEAVFDKRRLQSLGVLLPIRLNALSFMPGRHPLGRAGEGMRYLRTRAYEPGQDNPRDIDKFSPPGEQWVDEWESEARAFVRICGDVSHSMQFAPNAALRNLTLLQLTYSLWRASDQVRVVLYSADGLQELVEPNLRGQLEQLAGALSADPVGRRRDARDLLEAIAASPRRTHDDLMFVVSDFQAVTPEDSGSVARQWQQTLRRLSCDVIPVVISFELAREQRGTIKLWDAEKRRQRLTLLTPSRIDRINALERARVEDLEKLFRRLALSCLVLRHERDVYPFLANLARTRRGRAA